MAGSVVSTAAALINLLCTVPFLPRVSGLLYLAFDMSEKLFVPWQRQVRDTCYIISRRPWPGAVRAGKRRNEPRQRHVQYTTLVGGVA